MTAATRRHTAAGHTEGRRRASGAHTQRTEQGTGTGRRKGTQQNTAGDTQQPRNTQKAGGAEDKRKEGGERDADGLAPGGAVEEGSEEETRQQGGNRERKVCNIFKGEMRGKTPPRLTKACKRGIYISLNTAAWWLFIALSFIYYKGVYYIYLYILYNPD